MRLNRRVDAKITRPITKHGKQKKSKVATVPPKTPEMANLILDRLYERNPILSLTCQMSALTGLRYSDCSWLKYDDFYTPTGDFRESIHVCQQKTYGMRVGRKNKPMSQDEAFRKSIVVVYTNSEIEEVVKETRLFSNGSEFLFANPRSRIVLDDKRTIDRPMSVESADWHHDKVSKELNLDWQLGTHSWRKYFAKRLVKMGATVEEIRDLLGQSSLASTNAYLISIEDDLKNHIKNLTLEAEDK
ncbi:tyrosine-type recombinase/integrase [Vibrio aestuarianus subsp. cardii]|uniref:tyrosine-type recombinase/integrase n=1 Tax=Vibrio aestuarianus TaxID=28171 RepID=UPI0015587A48|nr:tyrosine-type recombinase/integrase [Vibrio aestuarianus]NGZ66652.1 tyrosine-type recombinase/integrase [Vibrio aestuarianus subsp. cardii]